MWWWLALGLSATMVSPVSSHATGAVPHDGPFWFHHLHLNDARPPFLLEFYERLFDPSTTRRIAAGRATGLQSGPMLLLINPSGNGRAEPTALWHFGWGAVSLGETYLAHAATEVAWEPPLPAGRFHLHLRSTSPRAAAEWYRDVLGARVDIVPLAPRASESLPRPEHRMPEALVWIGETGALIYRTDPPLFSTRGQTVDHVAIGCSSLDAASALLRSHAVSIGSEFGRLGELRTAMIEGPDRIAIEIVEVP